MMANKKQKEPLFYIQQPNFQFPKVKMQETYSSRKAEMLKKMQSVQSKETNTNTKVKEDKQVNQVEDKLSLKPEKVRETINEFETKHTKNEEGSSFSFKTARKPAFNRLKSFKEMDISEQLQYLAEFPKQLPPVPCNFELDGKSFKGTLKSKSNENIEVRLLNGELENISIQSIKSIKMLGLKK